MGALSGRRRQGDGEWRRPPSPAPRNAERARRRSSMSTRSMWYSIHYFLTLLIKFGFFYPDTSGEQLYSVHYCSFKVFHYK